MLSDFDLSKQSEAGGAPAGIKHITPNGIPLVDTKMCVADFRTNSFVGTEVSPTHSHRATCVLLTAWCRSTSHLKSFEAGTRLLSTGSSSPLMRPVPN